MRLVIRALVLLLVGVFPAAKSAAPPRAIFPAAAVTASEKNRLEYETRFFPQQLDHFTFRPSASKIFYQKYLINDHYWDKQSFSPIFVYTGNEGNIEWFADNTGFLFDIAPKFNALLIFIEVIVFFFQNYQFYFILMGFVMGFSFSLFSIDSTEDRSRSGRILTSLRSSSDT